VTRRKVNLFAAMMISLSLTFAGAALAGEATDVVKAKQTALFDLMRKNDASSNGKIAATFDEMLDYQTLAEQSLGSEWAARTDAERAEFSDLLKQLVRRAYERNLRKTLDFNIEYVEEKAKGETMVVMTRAVSKTDKRAEPIEIAYKLAKRDGAWRVQDIITDSVSLVSSYRSQFTKIVKKSGFPVLIQKMKDKLAKDDV